MRLKRALVLLSLLVAAASMARPGGGGGFSSHSSGGGGGHSSGGGGGGVIELIQLIIWIIEICVEYPAFGIPFVLGCIGFAIYTKWIKDRRRTYAEWSTLPPKSEDSESRQARLQLLGLRRQDPDFSLVLFEDFLYALYPEVHVARGADKLDRLAVFLSPNVIANLRTWDVGPVPVTDVIVGALRLVEVRRSKLDTEVEVEIETNSTQGGIAFWDVEHWTLSRKASTKSRPWSRASLVACPNCGAPLESVAAGRCASCKEEVGDGRFEWQVTAITRWAHEARPPILTGTTEEVGTDFQTIADPDVARTWISVADALGMLPPEVEKALNARVHNIFTFFQAAWSDRDLSKMTPYLSDTFLRMQERWVAAYKREKLVNHTDSTKLVRLERVRAVVDRYFAAVTLRVYAEGLDYTVDDHGKTVGGSKSQPRRYTEYWTLIRTLRAKGPKPVCPSCGAELDISMAGPCPYCKAQVTSACFDWVLSRIEQDEVYKG